MTSRAVELTVAGTRCRVVTTAGDEELAQLTRMVEEKLAAVLKPGRPLTTQAVLLAAIALAHDAREAKDRRDAVADKAREMLEGLLARVDAAIDEASESVDPRKPRRASDRPSADALSSEPPPSDPPAAEPRERVTVPRTRPAIVAREEPRR